MKTISINSYYKLIFTALMITFSNSLINAHSYYLIEKEYSYKVYQEGENNEDVVEELDEFLDHMGTKYKKGIDILRMLNEKILGLDHHFSAMKSYQNLMDMSNPNNFPEFVKIQNKLDKSSKKKQSFVLPALLSVNPIISTSFTLLNTLVSNNNSKEKEADIEKIACILDFTVSTQQDLKTIYFETEYLKLGSDKLQGDLSKLFENYTKVINYKVPLNKCRQEDDWESAYEALEKELARLFQFGIDNPESYRTPILKKIGTMEYQMDQLIDFMSRYAGFIEQGQKYYTKFDIILNSYQNKEQCSDKLPINYANLTKQIKETITKFEIAYNVTELKGTQLKELRYNYNE